MGFGKHKHTGMDKTISGGGGYEGIYFFHLVYDEIQNYNYDIFKIFVKH